MEVGIEKDENEPELTYLYEEVDPFNPAPPASESEPEDVMRLRTRLNPGMRLFLLVFMRQPLDHFRTPTDCQRAKPSSTDSVLLLH
nr:hypothetical protein [Tanacetum cinerariifolium]